MSRLRPLCAVALASLVAMSCSTALSRGQPQLPATFTTVRDVALPGDTSRFDYESIDPTTVGTVITLCAEEVCPVFLDAKRRVHWPIPDPASKDPRMTREEMLTRFRTARDTIRSLLERYAAELH